jgi:hypothetical protein
MAGILSRGSAHPIPTWFGPLFQALVLRIVALLINRYYYGFRIIMSINKTTHSPLALREGFMSCCSELWQSDCKDAIGF